MLFYGIKHPPLSKLIYQGMSRTKVALTSEPGPIEPGIGFVHETVNDHDFKWN